MRRPRFLVAAVVAAAVSSGIVASSALAADVTVSPLGCQNQGGTVTVGAGSTITIRQGVSEQTFGILRAYLNAQTTTISLNGTTVDVSDAFSAPEKRPTGDWASFVAYPTGITLQAGDSLSIVWVTTLAHIVPEVFNPAAGGPAGKPEFNGAPATFACTVTAV